ncbi:MAG: ROK family protein [Actinomycetaceae bacterium]|nr:ROK family protein [Actinomycetaceae bacterium]
MKGAERRIQRRINMLATIRALSQESLSITQLSKKISVSRPATEQVVADLAQLGWLQELEPQTAGGRPAIRWELSADALLVLSIDIGAHHATVNFAGHRGNIIGTATVEIEEDAFATDRIDIACDCAKRVVDDSEFSLDQIALICVGSPGAVSDGRVHYFGGHGMPGWQGIDLASEIEARLHRPVVTAGDCSLGALGEAWKGGAQGHQDVVYILSGMRTGAAAIRDGKVQAGFKGTAGLIGELDALRWREIEAETFIRKAYGVSEVSNVSEGDSGQARELPGRKQVFPLAEQGDEKAVGAVKEFSEILALGASAMVLAFGPTHVVVGGEFSAWSDLFLEDFKSELGRYCPIVPTVSASTLKEQAVCIGGVKFALDYALEKLRTEVLTTDLFPSAQHFDCSAK